MPYQNVQLTENTQRDAASDAIVKPIHQALVGIFSTGFKTSFVILAYVMSLPVINGSLIIDSL
jgi:phenylpyruvate tautomerase PptA (4-oxalocrotonate tautomerase family)